MIRADLTAAQRAIADAVQTHLDSGELPDSADVAYDVIATLAERAMVVTTAGPLESAAVLSSLHARTPV